MARLTGAKVNVEGLDELRREIRKLDEQGLTDQLKDANYEVASLVVDAAQARASSLGPMQVRAAESLKPGRQAARAVVSGGGARVPFFGGAEFGSRRDQERVTVRGSVKGWNQFDPWRGSGQGAGYFLYPSIRDRTPEIIDRYGDAIEKITHRAFPD